MCDKYNEIDEKIAHYRRISQYVSDQLTRERLDRMFEDLAAEKTALHPAQQA